MMLIIACVLGALLALAFAALKDRRRAGEPPLESGWLPWLGLGVEIYKQGLDTVAVRLHRKVRYSYYMPSCRNRAVHLFLRTFEFPHRRAAFLSSYFSAFPSTATSSPWWPVASA